MDLEQTFDDASQPEVEGNDQEFVDIQAMLLEARRSRQINETDLQAILATADEDQADRLYEQLQRMGTRIVSENGETVDDLADNSGLLEREFEEQVQEGIERT
ncbi:MAG TPA: hypothetical protein VLE70_16205, partial [Anaerolineae bacterium]|nr:hypothetical protein [Anaerolineae bacterium]